MEDAKFANFIRSLETFAAAKPGLYRLRVALIAALGYAYLLFIVLLLLGIVAAIFFYLSVNWIIIKIVWIPLALVGIILK